MAWEKQIFKPICIHPALFQTSAPLITMPSQNMQINV